MGAELVRQQFGANAQKYATSPVHAKGASLGRLVELIKFGEGWHALDVAAAAGHTAFALAPHVVSVVAADITPEMLEVGRTQAKERGLTNVKFAEADAMNLVFDDSTFDLVTCRIAPHHFDRPDRFVSEMTRVAKPCATIALVDNVVPNDSEVADFANHWEAKRDPSHVRCLSLDEWLDLFDANGLEIQHTELLAKRMGFDWWADNMAVPDSVQAELLAELAAAGEDIKAFLRPEPETPTDPKATVFHLTEAIIIATKPERAHGERA